MSAGSLPSSWSALSKLQTLDLSGNDLNGPLPPAWSKLARLVSLQLYSNDLKGSVPPAWGTWPRIANVTLYNNPRLSGCLPRAWRGKVNKGSAAEDVMELLTTRTDIKGFC
jgi:U3 small nucleolar RNA-associated protein 7